MCVNPILVKVTSRTYGVSRYVDAPCGHCVDCLKRRQNDWKLRLVHESSYWNNLFFFTLTYNNDSLPCRLDYKDTAYGSESPICFGSYTDCMRYCDDDMVVRSSACKSDIQKFLKRLRTNYERSHGHPLEMKYFICSEYGPNPNGTKRPHYHGLIMTNASYNDLLPEFNAWRDYMGRIDFKQVGIGRDQSSKVANYVSKYCAKGCFESRLADINNLFIERAWYIMSKNIGLRWFEDNKIHWLKYVPVSSHIPGDWTYDDVEKFFTSGSDKSVICAKELDALLDDFFVMDGESTFSYKMPRYYRERLLCVRKSFTNPITKLKDGKPIPTLRLYQSELHSDCCIKDNSVPFISLNFAIDYESSFRKDVRYVSENFLSVAFAYRLRMRIDNLYQEEFKGFRKSHYEISDSEIHLRLLRKRENARKYREQMSTQKMCDFYNQNMWNHREFDYELDSLSTFNYNIN